MPAGFDPKEFVTKLKAGQVFAPATLTGLIKPDEHSADSIMFAPGSSCSGWVKVPLSLLKDITVTGSYLCTAEGETHTHPIVTVELVRPGSPEGDAIIDLLAALAASHRVPPTRQQIPLRETVTHSTGMRQIPVMSVRGPGQRRFFSPAQEFASILPDCGIDEVCYYVGQQCSTGCACVNPATGEGYCSYCCIGL